MNSNCLEAKQALFDDIAGFLDSKELESVRTAFAALQKRIDEIPDNELGVHDNFTNFSVAFLNMMNWATEFEWDRNKKCFDHMIAREKELRKRRA